ncbi:MULTISPECIES: hypothetical protein [unclassified Pseudomonas]|uniref:hypothetical protein n=1 Tax=unclassified Pseudomonas TaxID=196821 RepID=UPI001CBF4A93|nr:MULTISPECIES: hypothetical protein [unclassified Pseudomonas]
MSRSADCRNNARKWMREPSSGTRIVVITAGLGSEHLELIHHSFSCFENIALMQVDVAPMSAGMFEAHTSTCDYCLVVAGELDKRFLRDLPKRRINIYPIARDARTERSVIEAVEQVKSLARANPPPRIDNESAFCRRCP